MRIYDLSNVNQIYLSPYVYSLICAGGVRLEHKLTGEMIYLQPKAGSLRTLWEGIQLGGDEPFWRDLLKLTESQKSIELEELIWKGYLE